MNKLLLTLFLFLIVLIINVPWDLTSIFFLTNDPLFQISKETWTLIMKSDITNNYEELVSWVNDYHGEANDQQIMIDIGRCSLRYKNGFHEINEFNGNISSTR